MVHLPEGTEMVMPGDNITMEVHLIVPIAMEEKLRFAIREGGRTVGAGVVASIIGEEGPTAVADWIFCSLPPLPIRNRQRQKRQRQSTAIKCPSSYTPSTIAFPTRA